MPKDCRLCVLWFCICAPLFAEAQQSLIDSAINLGRYAEAETQLRKQIDTQPLDWEAHFRLAQVLSWQDKFGLAELEYQTLLSHEPANADYLLGLGQVFVWRGQGLSALPFIEKAVNLAPDNVDIWRLHIQALVTVNDGELQKKALLIQQKAAARFPELDWNIVNTALPAQTGVIPEIQQASPNEAAPYSQIELGGSYDTLTNHKGFWRSEYLSFEHRYAAQQVVYGTLLQTERFLFNDEQFLLGGYYPLSTQLTMNLEGNVSPKPEVLANNSVMASIQGRIDPAWTLTGGYRHSEYGTRPLQQGFSTLEHYFDDFRAAYTLRATDSFDKTQFSHRFDFSYYYQDNGFVTITYNTGAEIGGFQGTVYETQFFGLHGRHWFNQDWALSWDLGHIKQGNAYSRDGVSLGIRRIF